MIPSADQIRASMVVPSNLHDTNRNCLVDDTNDAEHRDESQNGLPYNQEEEVQSNLPAASKLPIRFKDAVSRKFAFPSHLCKTWTGMEKLICEEFLHVDLLSPYVQQGHYDLIGPEGVIILPHVWETMVQPDWFITMHMWPTPEPKPVSPPQNGFFPQLSFKRRALRRSSLS